MSDQTNNLFNEEFVFMLASATALPSYPCLTCPKADGSAICTDAADCKRFLSYQTYKRQKKERWEHQRPVQEGGACEACPVRDACPVSFSAPVTWCKVKMDSIRLLETTRMTVIHSVKMHDM
jgi:hypothetical protein